jgi:hypothetical protein
LTHRPTRSDGGEKTSEKNSPGSMHSLHGRLLLVVSLSAFQFAPPLRSFHVEPLAGLGRVPPLVQPHEPLLGLALQIDPDMQLRLGAQGVRESCSRVQQEWLGHLERTLGREGFADQPDDAEAQVRLSLTLLVALVVQRDALLRQPQPLFDILSTSSFEQRLDE